MGVLGGWISKLFPNLQLTQAHYHVNFTVPDFILLSIGILLAIYITVKAPKTRSLVASVALAYEIYIPIGLAGFGITSGFPGLFPQGLEIVGIWLDWVIFAGTIFLTILKIRPTTIFGYLLTAALLGVALYTLLTNSAFGAALKSQLNATGTTPASVTVIEPTASGFMGTIAQPSLTPTLTPLPGTVTTREDPTPTNTLVPTDTATVTITPKPTPVYAQTYSSQSDGVVIRKTAGGDYLALLKVNTLVEILDTTEVDSRIWVHIRVVETGQEGWIVQSLLQTATPSPQW
jgi:hypothetical protein